MKKKIACAILFVLIAGCTLIHRYPPNQPEQKIGIAVTATRLLTTKEVLTDTKTPTPTTLPSLTPEPESALPSATPTPTQHVSSYTVKGGDTILSIASELGLSAKQIALANEINRINKDIEVGRSLVVPDLNLIPFPTIKVGKQIIVVVSIQKLFAFEDGKLVKQFSVSTGLPSTPTKLGEFKIYAKSKLDRMTGPGYDILAPWLMYFHGRYALHGVEWNENFGKGMSRGSVNLIVEDAKWLYGWSQRRTVVTVIK